LPANANPAALFVLGQELSLEKLEFHFSDNFDCFYTAVNGLVNDYEESVIDSMAYALAKAHKKTTTEIHFMTLSCNAVEGWPELILPANVKKVRCCLVDTRSDVFFVMFRNATSMDLTAAKMARDRFSGLSQTCNNVFSPGGQGTDSAIFLRVPCELPSLEHLTITDFKLDSQSFGGSEYNWSSLRSLTIVFTERPSLKHTQFGLQKDKTYASKNDAQEATTRTDSRVTRLKQSLYEVDKRFEERRERHRIQTRRDHWRKSFLCPATSPCHIWALCGACQAAKPTQTVLEDPNFPEGNISFY